MSDDSSPVRSLTANITELKEELERDLEHVLNHPCRVAVEEFDTNTGEVTVRAELDLAELRDRLREVGKYDGVRIGLNDDFTIQLSPIDD